MNSELSMDQVLIEKLTDILEVNLDNEQFCVKKLASEAGLSRSQLHRKLHSITGKSASRFIREYRLEKAMEFLQNNSATVSEIAYRVGFGSPTYFNTCFHDYYGYPPGEVKFRNPKIIEDDDESENMKLIDDSQAIGEAPSVKKHLLRKRMVWVNTVFIVLLSVISYSLYQNYKDIPAEAIAYADKQDKSIAIIPFKNLSGDIENQYFVDGVTGSIQNHLNEISNLKVIPASSMEKYRQTTLTPLDITKEVDVSYLLMGSVQRHKDSIRVISSLVNAKDNEQLKSFVFDWEYKNIFEIQSKIALEIAEQLDVTITPEKIKTIKKHPTENLEAYNLYLKGRFFWHRRTEKGINKSIDYFNQAIKLDSTYALAYAGLADSYFISGFWNWMPREVGFKKGIKYAKKALSMDKTIAGAHATLGGVYLYQNNRDLEASEAEFKKAISMNPNYATGYHFYADYFATIGNRKEAINQINIALQLNPNSYMMNYNGAQHYYYEERFEEALECAIRAKEIDDKQQRNRLLLFSIYVQLGNYDLATVEIEEFYRLDPNTAEVSKDVRKAFNKGGIKGVFRYMIAVDYESGYADKNPTSQVLQYAFLNDAENAFVWLEKAAKGDATKIIDAINNDFRLKKLQNSLEYKVLLKKMDYQLIKD